MAFNHTTYKHNRGLRSRPRTPEQMELLFAGLRQGAELSSEARHRHARKNLTSRVRELQMARASIEQWMPDVRQEQARNSRDPERRRRYGAELTYLSKRARDERRLLMRMLGEWK